MSNFGNNGTNTLAYEGVLATTPPQMLYQKRAPTANDCKNLKVGTFWFYTNYPQTPKIYELWQLADLTGNQAVWKQIYPVTGTDLIFTANDASTASPNASGVINVVGDGVDITTTAAGNTLTITALGDVTSSFVTDSGPAVPVAGVINFKEAAAIEGTARFQGSGNTVSINFTDSTLNTGVGSSALSLNTGSSNCAYGAGALASNTSGSNSTAVGTGAALTNSTSSNLSAFGYQALKVTTAQNDAFGYQSQVATTTGTGNCSFGFKSLHAITTSSDSTAVGYNSQLLATTGPNDSLGALSLASLTGGGTANVALGYNSLSNLVTGSGCVGIGYTVGSNYTGAESNNILIGVGVVGLTGESGSIRIGSGLYAGEASNTIKIGTSSAQCIFIGSNGSSFITPVDGIRIGSLGDVGAGSSPFNFILIGAAATSRDSSNSPIKIGSINAGTICIGAQVNDTSPNYSINIGTSGQQTSCFVQGINGVNVGSTAKVATVASTGQLGTATITAGGGITVTPGANTITISTSGSGGGFVGFSAYLSTTQNPVTGFSTTGFQSQSIICDTVIFDTTGGYNNSTGYFVAQVNGYYQFMGTAFAKTTASYADYIGCFFERVAAGGSLLELYYGDQQPTNTSSDPYQTIGTLAQVNINKIIYMNAGDRVVFGQYRYITTSPSTNTLGYVIAGADFTFGSFPTIGAMPPNALEVVYTSFQGYLLQ